MWLAYVALIAVVLGIPAWTYLFATSRYDAHTTGPEAIVTLVPLGLIGLIVPGMTMRHLDTAGGSFSLTVGLLLGAGVALGVGLLANQQEVHSVVRVLPAAPLLVGTMLGFLWDIVKRLSEFSGIGVGAVILLALLGVGLVVLKATTDARLLTQPQASKAGQPLLRSGE